MTVAVEGCMRDVAAGGPSRITMRNMVIEEAPFGSVGCADAAVSVSPPYDADAVMVMEVEPGTADAPILVEGLASTVAVAGAAPAPAPAVEEDGTERVPTMDEVFTITYEQFLEVRSLTSRHRQTKFEPREPKPIEFVEPGADLGKWLVERVDRQWEEELAGRLEGVPDLVVYGHFKKTPAFEGRAWVGRVFHPVMKEYHVHCFFDRLWFSNFLDLGGVIMRFEGKQCSGDCLLHSTGEHAFQTVKVLQVKTDAAIYAIEDIVLAKKPLEALKAAGAAKLPGLPKWWDKVSGEVMRAVVMNLIHNEDDFAKPMVKLAEFCKGVLNVNPGTNLFIHEGNDNKIYGVDIAEGENPLKDRGVFVDGGYKWNGGDKLGQALTEVMRTIVKDYGCSFQTFDQLEEEKGDMHQLSFKVLPPEDEEDGDEAVGMEAEEGPASLAPAETTASGVIGTGRTLSYVAKK
jgi:predicted NAD-dependent protein-ADP-ribosyltransferase YbiA (DUF1768 family)